MYSTVRSPVVLYMFRRFSSKAVLYMFSIVSSTLYVQYS